MSTRDTTDAVDEPGGPLLAGLDLLTVRERHADELAFAAAAALQDEGGRGVTVGTHWADLDGRRHVALVVQVAGLDQDQLARLLDALAFRAEPEERGLLVGERFSGTPSLRPVLESAIEAQHGQVSGRAVVFPGSSDLPATITVGALTTATPITRVQVLGAGEAEADTPLLTRAFVRPLWSAGELVLHAQPAAGGVLVPFESPDPTPCCAAHT